jgi:hypothetical protein
MAHRLSRTLLSASLPKGYCLDLYSRRQFLKLSGITLAGSLIGLPTIPQHFSTERTFQGRALAATAVYRSPNSESSVVETLWPDSVNPLIDAGEGWYRVAKGYVPHEGLQPITPFLPQTTPQIPAPSFWAEVAAPVAPVRQTCAADSPLVARIGHGGVVQVVDYLPGEPNGWYGVADGKVGFLGWSQAVHWQALDEISIDAGDHHLELDLANQRLTAYENGEFVLQAPCSTNGYMNSGIYTIESRQHSDGILSVDQNADGFYGVPWILRLEAGHDLTGVYWHNRFGRTTPGSSIQVTPLLARWLYGWLPDGSQIEVK